MNNNKQPGRVDDFTSAFLISFGVLVFIMLWTISIVFGFLWALGSAYACDKGLSRFTLNRE
jgi:hypothetical protein